MKKDRSDSDRILAEADKQRFDLPESRRIERFRQVTRQRQRGLMVIMEDVHNAHNLAAIARSCDAFGVQQIGAILEDPEHFDPAGTVKITSASASKWLDYQIYQQGSHKALTLLKDQGWHIMATVADESSHSLYDYDFAQYPQLALLVGNERHGLSRTALALADSHVYIPMVGMIHSLNVSVATAIILAEITRQRNASDTDFTLSDAEAEALVYEYIKRDR